MRNECQKYLYKLQDEGVLMSLQVNSVHVFQVENMSYNEDAKQMWSWHTREN